ncbi:MAG: DUF721 domain-containing protein [Kofleriaceae bacterium]|nr:DUF721 domain-containing protein [Kofleriaceae bacterium]
MKKPPTRARRAREMQHAATAIANTLAVHGISDEVRGQRLYTEWTELVGPKIAQRTRPEGITDRVLWIEVATSAWLHELNLLRPQLMNGLRTRLGEPSLFDEVRFKLAGRSRRPTVQLPTGRTRTVAPPRPQRTPASGAAREKIVSEVEAVEDDELRELIARVRITHDR